MSTKRILYGSNRSPAVRAVHMTLVALNLEYEFKFTDPHAGDTKTAEFLKKNPQHTIPTLEDEDGNCVWDSHAIMAYLVRKYGNGSSLYPKDYYQRAIVDQRLHFESSVLWSAARQALGPIIQGQIPKTELAEKLKTLDEKYDMLETFLGDNDFIAGKSLTIADFSIIATVAVLVNIAPLDSAKYPKLTAWLERMKKLPYYETINAEGVRELGDFIQSKIAEIS